MSNQDDVRLIIEQEKALVLPEFSEEIAFKLGAAIRANALAAGLGIAAEIRTGERRLFYTAMAGTTANNANWLRRKANLVHRVSKSSYRVVQERNYPEDFFPARLGLDNVDFVLAGGGFPIWVKQAGMIGSICVSGLHERDDHRLVVEALCDHLGIDRQSLALPPLTA
ncbi:MAG: heme-degrading domain-containing protein [Hyphomicrobiales bacterium]|nr:MAG: heme-degrading domain-containing protein [Hyphomicrobiales bacterium]